MSNKIKDMGFSKLTNAEHLSFHNQVMLVVEKCDAENISAVEELALYKTSITSEVDVVNQQSASSITQDLETKDKERDDLLSYLFSSIHNAKNAPMATFKEAYKQLTPAIKPYQGIANKSNPQETAEIMGLVNDLKKDTLAGHIATLGLTDVLNLIETTNNDYVALDQKRSADVPDKKNTLQIRAKIDELYDSITDKTYATVLLAPNDNAKTLIDDINKIIDKTNTSYNQRNAKRDGTNEE